jgi:sulfate adenylyltransferase
VPTPAPPQFCPTPRELDDLELLANGALAPVTGFDEPGSPVTLDLPAEVLTAAEAAGAVEIVDPEGLPLALVTVPGGAVTALAHPQYGPFRRLYLAPAAARARYAGRTVVPVVDAISERQLADLSQAGPLLLLALVGHGTGELPPTGLLRATLAAADLLPDAAVVAVPLASHGDAETDHALGVQVAANYAGPDPVRALVADPEGKLPPTVAAVVDRERPEPSEQGLVLFFTGLSGSGKSTLAQALMDRVLEQGARTVTSLDGDVVRRNLSAGLTFSKEDRETNIRRIGWVAAEVARHGGLAVCSPIAPFDQTRQQVRAMVEDAGGAFFLVHVATPLEECERRDRKGLYAKARRGEIPEFTGISSPYEEPADADVRVDTTGRTIEDALDDVVDALADAGYLDLRAGGGFETVASATSSTTEPLKVLFVCTANICRSPYMEVHARALAGPDSGLEFSSAGTHGFRERAMDDEMAAALAAALGADAPADDRADFRSRPLTAELLRDADLVLTAERTHRQLILDDHPAEFRKVFTLGQFAAAVSSADPDLRGRALLAHTAEHRGAADAALDIPDPYRRGADAARTCGTRIDDLLRVIIPSLSQSGRIAP